MVIHSLDTPQLIYTNSLKQPYSLQSLACERMPPASPSAPLKTGFNARMFKQTGHLVTLTFDLRRIRGKSMWC